MTKKHTSSPPTTYKMGELFCGPGGIALGAHNAADEIPGIKIEHAWANDYDPTTADTYRENTPGASEETVYVGDVRELDTDALPPIDGFAFGFPCNDFSLVGKQKGLDGTYGPLYSYGINVLKSHKPEWFVAENVGGLSGANEGLAFPYILREMQRAGYTIVAHKYRFEEYGLPQARHRIIIVGLRNDVAAKGVAFKVPAPTTPEPSMMRTAKQAITEPPIPEWATNNEPTRQSEVVKQRLAYIKPGENAFNATDMPEELRLNVRGAKLSQIYKRLDPNKPAYTVTGSVAAERTSTTGKSPAPSLTASAHVCRRSLTGISSSVARRTSVARLAWRFPRTVHRSFLRLSSRLLKVFPTKALNQILM